MEGSQMTLMQAWTPTFIATGLILVAGILLGMKIERDDRKAEREGRKKTSS